jgi:manganese-dependent inorganic pyrophosphatase
VNEDGTPFGLVNGGSLFAYINSLVGTHASRQEMRISEILDSPCEQATNTKIPSFVCSARIRDMLNRILRDEYEDFLIVDEAGQYFGVWRQRDALNPPRMQIVMVDHNEPRQAVGALEEAQVLEILDHHRLGNSSTHTPIKFTVDIVGSTSTLVTERIEEAGLSAPPALAGMLLAG